MTTALEFRIGCSAVSSRGSAMSDATGWHDYRVWSLTRRVPGSCMWAPRSSRAAMSGGLLPYVERTAATRC